MAADQITLTAETGRPVGSRSSRRLRAEGKVPAVVYGAGTDPTAIAVRWSDLRAALITDAGMNALITLDVDGDERLTIVKDMQRHPVRRDVTHVDFIVIDRNKAIDVDVPVVLEDTEGDNLAGLVVDQQLFSLAISAKPGSIPNELGWIGPAVHLEKGCYRGQETVARVHTLGRPPRRLTLLHLDGSENRLPVRGSDVTLGEKAIGFVGTSARHHELGPIALALIKRNVPVDAVLTVEAMPAAQEVIVDPEVGLHVRPQR